MDEQTTRHPRGVFDGPANPRYQAPGTVRVITSATGRRHVRVKCRDGGECYARWHMLARVVWQARHGRIPYGHCLWHINGDGADCRLENLELITLAERLRRNMAANAEACDAARRRTARKNQPLAALGRRIQSARNKRRLTAEHAEVAEVKEL